MATIEDVQARVATLTQSVSETQGLLESMDLKLDEIRAFIATLTGGGVVTQEQLDQLSASLDSVQELVNSARTKASENLAETDALDEPQA